MQPGPAPRPHMVIVGLGLRPAIFPKSLHNLNMSRLACLIILKLDFPIHVLGLTSLRKGSKKEGIPRAEERDTQL